MYLTHLDYQDTERIMTEKLQNQVNGTEWSWKNLNTVSCSYFTVITWVKKSFAKVVESTYQTIQHHASHMN